MISAVRNVPRYRCANPDNPSSQAIFCCQHEGCAAYPFMCGDEINCNCMSMHSNHQSQVRRLEELVNELATPLELPNNVLKEEQAVESLIGGLINTLEGLRNDHRQHINQRRAISPQYASLIRKIIAGDELLATQAKGSEIANTLKQFRNTPNTGSAYVLVGQTLNTELHNIKTASDRLVKNIHKLWKRQDEASQLETDPFIFSETLKRPNMGISEDLKQVRLTSENTQGLVLLEPPLNTGVPSKVIFRIDRIGYHVAFGICLKDISLKCGFDGQTVGITDHGLYVASSNGEILSTGSGLLQDGQKIKFLQGDSVSVEFDPSAGRITYLVTERGWGWWRQQSRKYVQRFPLENLKPGALHFCTRLNNKYSGGCEISLVD